MEKNGTQLESTVAEIRETQLAGFETVSVNQEQVVKRIEHKLHKASVHHENEAAWARKQATFVLQSLATLSEIQQVILKEQKTDHSNTSDAERGSGRS